MLSYVLIWKRYILNEQIEVQRDFASPHYQKDYRVYVYISLVHLHTYTQKSFYHERKWIITKTHVKHTHVCRGTHEHACVCDCVVTECHCSSTHGADVDGHGHLEL